MTDQAHDFAHEVCDARCDLWPTSCDSGDGDHDARCVVVALSRDEADMAPKLRDLLRDDPDAVYVVLAQESEIDADQAVALMRAGAYDVLIQPLAAAGFAKRMAQADAEARRRAAARHERRTAATRLERLTPRETDVVIELAAGASNKVAARRLGLSPRTVEFHRARIFEKLEISNVALLARMVFVAQLDLTQRTQVVRAA